jgi:hypothetical protein
MATIELKEFDETTLKLLGKAGLDPRCTPNILRAKVESKMKLQPGELDIYRVRMKKLIIKWWKQTQVKDTATTSSGDSAKSSGEKRTTSSSNSPQSQTKKVKSEPSEAMGNSGDDKIIKYKLFRRFARANDKQELLAGLTDIPLIPEKLKELKNRLRAAGLKASGLTEADCEELENKNK